MSTESLYTEELADEICQRLAGGRSLLSICGDDDMPDKSQVFRWLGKYESFRDKYARAREAWAEYEFENMMSIADTPKEGQRTKESDEGTETTYEDMLGHRSLQVSTRKWVLERMAPRKYGQLIKNEVTNPDGSLRGMSEEQAAAKLDLLMRTLARRKQEQEAEGSGEDDGSDLV